MSKCEGNLFRLSIVIPTRDRPCNLAELMASILEQSQLPSEVIIVDDSLSGSARQVTTSFSSKFSSAGCNLRYIEGYGKGLTAARNIGIAIFESDAVFFLDDDTLLESNTIIVLTTFLNENQSALGVQPNIISPKQKTRHSLMNKLENIFCKVLMVNYREANKFLVRRSGASVFPSKLTKVIKVQRLAGCCCYKRVVFNELRFDENLKRWCFLEDLDFSYRLYKKNPQTLYAIPQAKIIHKTSEAARLPSKSHIHMTTIYWFYVFFKDVFDNSILNLMAFLWGLLGNLIVQASLLIIKRKPKSEWYGLIHLFGSYVLAFRNLKNILMRRLEFFNRNIINR